MSNAATARITEREYLVRMAAINAAYSAPSDPPISAQPSEAEALYLRARQCFTEGRQTLGWDLMDQADALVEYS